MNRAAAAGEGGLAGVEAEVEAALGEARQLAPASPEPLQALASLRQQQGKDEEALAVLRQSLALWFKPTPDSDAEEEEGGTKAAAAAGGGAEAAADEVRAPAAAGSAARTQACLSAWKPASRRACLPARCGVASSAPPLPPLAHPPPSPSPSCQAEEEELGSQDTDSDGMDFDEGEGPCRFGSASGRAAQPSPRLPRAPGACARLPTRRPAPRSVSALTPSPRLSSHPSLTLRRRGRAALVRVPL